MRSWTERTDELTPRPASFPERDAKLLATLQPAMQEVFELMLACSLEVSSEHPPETGLDVTSIVGLAGQLCGIVSIRCSVKSAAGMASRMLGIDPDQVGPEMWDAVGEVCNLVAGNLKHRVEGLGDGCMLSVPTVIRGADYRVTSPGNKRFQALFRFDGEPVVLALEVHC